MQAEAIYQRAQKKSNLPELYNKSLGEVLSAGRKITKVAQYIFGEVLPKIFLTAAMFIAVVILSPHLFDLSDKIYSSIDETMTERRWEGLAGVILC